MKKKLWMAAVAALGLAAVSQAGTIVYQSDFTGSDLGSGLASAGAATDIWSLNAANDRAEFNDGDDVQNSRASLYTTSSYQSTGGFKLDVTFYQAATDLNTFSIALVDADDSDLSYGRRRPTMVVRGWSSTTAPQPKTLTPPWNI
jgi:hypothetical protein